MLKTLKMLYILLKVLVLLKTIIAVKDLESLVLNISSFKYINIHDYVSSNNESVQNYSDSVTVTNKVVLQKDSTLPPNNFPSEPTFPRAFVEFGNRLDKKDIFVTFRWNKPELTTAEIQKYRIQYFDDLNRTITIVDIFPSPNRILQHKVYNLKPNTIYYFNVQAHNEFAASNYTKFIKVSTSLENPIPLLLATTGERYVEVLDVDLQIGFEIYTDVNYKEIVYSALEDKIYGITVNNELITADFNRNKIEINLNYTKITNLSGFADGLSIDWIDRNLYWSQYIIGIVYIMKLDLTLWQQMDKHDIILTKFLINSELEAYSNNVYPYTWYSYWLYFSDNLPMQMRSNFNGINIKSSWDKNKCSCLYKLNESFMYMKIDTSHIEPYWTLAYWIVDNRLIVTDINACNCKLILNVDSKYLYPILIIDNINIYLFTFNKTEQIMYILNKKYVLLESKENAIESVKKISMKVIEPVPIALDKSLQLYPSTICLIPNMTNDYHVHVLSIVSDSVEMSLPKPILNDGCKNNLSTIIYNISVSYFKCLYNGSKQFEQFNVLTYERRYEMQDLMVNTTYTLKLAFNNFYIDKLKKLQFGSERNVTGFPLKINAPENVTVQVLTPTLAIVQWMPPKKLNCLLVTYEVHWYQLSNSTQKIIQNSNFSTIVTDNKRTVAGQFSTVIASLQPKHQYKIYVHVNPLVDDNLVFTTDSLIKTVYMSEPNNLTLNGINTNSINISWISTINLTIHTEFCSILEYKNNATQEWQSANNTAVSNNKITYYIENLQPQTLYKFRLILKYPKYMNDFIWSPDEGFTFKTLESIEMSTVQDLSGSLYSYLPILILSLVVIIIIICYIYYFYSSYRQSERSEINLSSFNNESTINEIPLVNSELNSVYNSNLQSDPDEFARIKIEKGKIILGQRLGSGAFGEVYRGIIKNLEGLETTPVAIKMLRKNVSSQQQEEFLEEAKLMKQFDHKHVLRLLGICFDEDSPWLILELMEGGDLLNYLRDSRVLHPEDPQALRLQDLLAMCEDVARGCRYLEEQHFVHRDLACRNCLISTRNRENRIVKISDFGLARDIYFKDYYRVMKENILPVRWMAPESFIDRVFTSQSDVWAFGILMWEIMSLGYVPYLEIIHDQDVIKYVCTRNILSRPFNCPDELYELMRRCWTFAANDRPNFIICLETIVNLREEIEDAILHWLLPAENAGYHRIVN